MNDQHTLIEQSITLIKQSRWQCSLTIRHLAEPTCMGNQANVHEATGANYCKSKCCCSTFLKLSTVCHLMTLAGKWFYCEIILGQNKYL